jgi:hypothetical protein
MVWIESLEIAIQEQGTCGRQSRKLLADIADWTLAKNDFWYQLLQRKFPPRGMV